MGIELWFKDDIRNLLLSLNASSAGAARWGLHQHLGAYRQGYQEALCAVALACGIAPALIGLNGQIPPEDHVPRLAGCAERDADTARER